MEVAYLPLTEVGLESKRNMKLRCGAVFFLPEPLKAPFLFFGKL